MGNQCSLTRTEFYCKAFPIPERHHKLLCPLFQQYVTIIAPANCMEVIWRQNNVQRNAYPYDPPLGDLECIAQKSEI